MIKPDQCRQKTNILDYLERTAECYRYSTALTGVDGRVHMGMSLP